jgi:DNA-directed RNA polymerase specialized sigma24 family protein
VQTSTFAIGEEMPDVQLLYRQQADRCGRLAFLLSGDHEEAAELVQEAFARLITRWENIKDPNALEGYLRLSIINVARKN